MTCQESLALYSEYLDGALPEEVRERFEVHLARCESCARYHRIMREGLRLVRELPEVEPSPDFHDRLQHRIFHLLDERIEPRRRGRTATVATIAAAAVVAFALLQQPQDETPAFETTPTAEFVGATQRYDAGARSGWLMNTHAGYMNPSVQPSISLAFPGPYSPLIVEPPLRGGGRVHFTSLLE